MNNYFIIPLSTIKTALNIKREINDPNILVSEILKPNVKYENLNKLINIIRTKHFTATIFTSKTTVDILWKYLSVNREDLTKLFREVYAIGQGTADEIRSITHNLNIKPNIYVPNIQKSEGLIKLLSPNKRYLLISSNNVNKELANYVTDYDGFVIKIYDISVDLNSIEKILNIIRHKDFRKLYLIFTSKFSINAWFKLMSQNIINYIQNREIYAIAISRRVSELIPANHFKYIYTYYGDDITKFPIFIRNIIKITSQNRRKIPMFIDISNWRVLILGGGEEATKKALRLLSYGARVTVYSLEFSEELIQLYNNNIVTLIKGDVRKLENVIPLIDNHDMVVYTVPDLTEIENIIKEICENKRKICILSTSAEKTRAALPIETEVHDYIITIFTDGKSTLAAKYVANEIKEFLRNRLDLKILLETMHFAKKYMRNKGISYKERMKLYHIIFNDKVYRDLITSHDMKNAYSRIEEIINMYIGGKRE